MDYLSIIFIAIGLCADSFAVSLTTGLQMKKFHTKNSLRVALYLGFFQGLMPFVGWALGIGFKSYVESVDHWIAFGLLSIIGGKMIYEAFKKEEIAKRIDFTSRYVLIGMGIATSIDALAIGVTFAFINISILSAASIIGLVTFLASFMGVYLGTKIVKSLTLKFEAVGGFILIGIGTKILVEHLCS